jgi:hypothetical protein
MEKRGNMRNSSGCRDDNLRLGIQESNLGHVSLAAPAIAMGHSKGRR